MPFPNPALTIDDIYALPEGQRAELINGKLYMMAPPNRIHQKLSNRLSQKITNYIKMDYSIKNALYSNAGVREYWIVDPSKERTTVYRYQQDAAPMIFMFDQEIPVGIYDGLRICIAKLIGTSNL